MEVKRRKMAQKLPKKRKKRVFLLTVFYVGRRHRIVYL